ncbi:MAG: PAS domain S-box protein [Bacteroidales bacterium]|nr:PAS domain S-box protein [Bacteroidales bacterium]MBN2758405.1 PAS domain S-box protein [Bacteroidales bacterium]
MKKSTYIYRRFERFWHWSQVLLIFFLVLTGFEIHSSYEFFGFENAVKWHNIAAWAFLVLIVFAIFWHFVTGEWKQYMPTTKYMMAQINYYIFGIFKGAPHPTHKTVYNKFNPLQRFTYLGLKLLVIPVQVITGFIYMFYMYPENPIHIGGLSVFALIHTLGAFSLIAFVILHVYLTTTGETPLTSIKAMLTGWEVVDVDEQEEHAEHLKNAVKYSIAGYYRLDENGNFLDVNEAWLKMYKCTDKEQIIGKHYSITRKEDDVKELDEVVKQVFEGKIIKAVPATRICKDGSLGKHILSANPTYAGGDITGMEGFIIDITDLDVNSEHLHYAVKNSQAGYYRVNCKGYYEDVNDAWLNLYGYEREEVLGNHYSLSRTKEDLHILDDMIAKIMKGKSISNMIATRKRKDGSVAKHIVSANPVYKNEEVVGMEGFILDISNIETKL